MIRRVRDRATFAALARAPRVRRGPVAVRGVPAADGPPRVAYALGRSLGSAVVRNRIRRRLRAVVAAHADELPSGAYLVTARREAATMPFPELEAALVDALRTAGRP